MDVSGGQKIDSKDAPGSDGESTTQQGEKAKTGKIIHRMWEPEQWEDFDDAYEVIEPPAGKRKPLDIAHATASFRNVGAILIETVEGPKWDPSKTWMEWVYTWKEHRPPPPKNTTAKNTGSQATAGSAFEHMPNRPPREKRLLFGDEDGDVLKKAVRESSSQGFATQSGQAS